VTASGEGKPAGRTPPDRPPRSWGAGTVARDGVGLAEAVGQAAPAWRAAMSARSPTLVRVTTTLPPPSVPETSPAAVEDGLDAWRTLPAAQQPDWPDADALTAVTGELATYPPLVFAGECDDLKARLAAAARGEAFLLQGGDCAESFADATAERIRLKLKTMLQMAVVLTYGASLPVVKVGRMAGQYSKPRSKPTEVRDGVELPTFRGDAVNDNAFTAQARTPDPSRLLRAYHTSSMTLNLIRAFTKGGFADLRHVHEWNRGFVANAANARYEAMARDIDRAMRFMAACGGDFDALRTVDFYSSHEALLLDYERALTRIDSRSGLPYNVSAHLLWIGERTRQLDGAHVDLLSRVRNPIGVKIGPTTAPAQAVELVERLDPQHEPGRLAFVSRMGADRVREKLPLVVDAVASSGATVLWVCDPMHGNTFESEAGYKTRRFDDVIEEVRGFFEVHQALGTVPGGLHVELTGDDVTECLGGAEQIDEAALATRYETLCDPRLNHQQSLELAFLVAEMLTEG
jgi:3-deoxy-7-phosphoheptulonate synthase